MKIKVKRMDYDKAANLPGDKKFVPKKPNIFFRTLVEWLSEPELKSVNFRCRKIGMERLEKNQPCLILMNHSSFIDLKIAFKLLYPRPFNIVCTLDGFVGKRWLMRNLGCIPTNKFVTDTKLVYDIKYALKKLRSSVLMYPEASYSFDGTATPLPKSLGKFLKLMDVPVIMIRTYGAFTRDPLYNGLRLRRVDVSCDMEYLLSCEDIKAMSCDELNAKLAERFDFDNFKWQQENGIVVSDKTRAEGLNRVLYKCPACKEEGKMASKGSMVYCTECGKAYELTETGFLKAKSGETEFDSVPKWYRWEREWVKKEIESGKYRLDIPVDIKMLVNTDCIYEVGEGRLTHSEDGFTLTGCGGKLSYFQRPAASYSLYSDYFWYEIGDMICIGDKKVQYYCFPKTGRDVVAKTRLAAEELYKLVSERRTVNT